MEREETRDKKWRPQNRDQGQRRDRRTKNTDKRTENKKQSQGSDPFLFVRIRIQQAKN
jgi:hypothetical protein